MSNGLSEEEEFEFRLRFEREQAGRAPAPAAPPQAPAQPQERSFVESIPRQIGLTARAGIEGVTAPATMLGDVAGLRSSEALRNLLTGAGLPEPESGTEQFANVVAGGMAGAGGVAGAAARASRAAPAARAIPAPGGAGTPPPSVASQIAEAPGLAVASGGMATAGGEGAKELGGGPVTQFLAALAAGAIAPASISLLKTAGGLSSDVVNALRAAFGNEKAVERITEDAVKELSRANPKVIANILETADSGLPGVRQTVGEAVAARNLTKPDEQVGGALISMQRQLTGARDIEDIIPSFERQQGQAVKQYIDQLNVRTDPMRENALAAAQARGGAKPTTPLMAIHRVLRTPEGKTEVGTRALNKVRRKIARRVDPRTGRVDPADLYIIRREIGNDIAGFIKPGTKWDRRQTARLEREIQKSIDDAIEDAGGTGWKSYLDTYAKGMKPVQSREKALEQMGEIGKIVESRSPKELAAAELPKLPTLLHRPTMAVNFALRLIARDATEPVTRELAKRMTDPQKFLELLRRPERAPARQAMNVILARAAILAGLIQQHQEELAAQEGE